MLDIKRRMAGVAIDALPASDSKQIRRGGVIRLALRSHPAGAVIPPGWRCDPIRLAL
jgi:hypothetical protein